MPNLPPLLFLIAATTLEALGDAVVRMGVYNHAGLARLGLFLGGGALLFGYGLSLNLAPLEFSRVVGLYIATLFVVWQIVNFIAFRTSPTLPVLAGGALIVIGGLVVTLSEAGVTPMPVQPPGRMRFNTLSRRKK